MNRIAILFKVFMTLSKTFGFVCVIFITLSCDVLMAQADCRVDCPPRDDRAFLQSVLEACPGDAICKIPDGVFTVSASLEVTKSISIQGAGGGPGRKSRRPGTEIRVPEGSTFPAFAIEGSESDIIVSIRDISLVGGGIKTGGQKDPCLGIDDPFDLFKTNLILQDISIIASSLHAIQFEGGSLSLKDVKVADDANESGLYIANASGDIVIIDAEFVENQRWGIYICNMEGTGQIFMNDVSARDNGRGGIAIVGKGSPPNFRTLCMQNTSVLFNFRYGILLVDVAKSLLFNIGAGFTFFEQPGRFGDGIAVSASDDVYFWNVTAGFNDRAGYFVFGPDATQSTHVHMVGDISSVNNPIHAAVEGNASFHAHTGSTISGLCGSTTPFNAPSADLYCEENSAEVNCVAQAVNFEPPDPSP